jgi:hypothetical protein
MAGLINAKKISDPILRQIESGIDKKVPPQLRSNYTSIIVASMKIIYSSEASKRIADKLRSSQDVQADVSQGTANIIAMVYNEVSKNMDDKAKVNFINASMPACISLMCQLLDFAEKLGAIEVTKDIAAEVSIATSKEMLKKFGITDEMVDNAVAQGQNKGGA